MMRTRISTACAAAGTCLLVAQMFVSFAALDADTALTCALGVVYCARMAKRSAACAVSACLAISKACGWHDGRARIALGEVESSGTDAEKVGQL